MAESQTQIKFVRDPHPHECTEDERKKLKEGATVSLPEASAQRWIRRGAAEPVESKTTGKSSSKAEAASK